MEVSLLQSTTWARYSEVRCTLCAVSFNIARLRLLDEPQEAGWQETFSDNGECSAAAGCFYIPLRRELEIPQESDEKAKDEDESYIYESDTGEEAYEYESDDNLVDSVMEDETSSAASDESDDLYKKFLQDFKDRPGISPRPEQAPPVPIVQNYASEFEEEQDKKVWGWCEHIPGPNCTSTAGYNGHKISFDEMKGSTSFQCLMEKKSGWAPIEDDEPFELESNFFLTGLGIDMPSRDANSPWVFPARHGEEEIAPEDHYDYIYDAEKAAMPFHTTCFEVYKYVSRDKLDGKVEVRQLMEWWASTEPDKIPEHPDVLRNLEQWWLHWDGTEWLVSNPVHIPLLSNIFESVITGTEIDPYSGVFPLRPPQIREPNHDPFSLLPAELSNLILSYLPSSDIATLRLVSREFEQLPVSLFHSLLCQEMPWLWEIWSQEPVSHWGTTTKMELVAREKRRALYKEDLRKYRGVIKEEMPELLDDWMTAERSFDDYEPILPRNLTPNALPRTRTNWFELYRAITTNWEALRGLQNRRRIWSRVTQIVEGFNT